MLSRVEGSTDHIKAPITSRSAELDDQVAWPLPISINRGSAKLPTSAAPSWKPHTAAKPPSTSSVLLRSSLFSLSVLSCNSTLSSGKHISTDLGPATLMRFVVAARSCFSTARWLRLRMSSHARALAVRSSTAPGMSFAPGTAVLHVAAACSSPASTTRQLATWLTVCCDFPRWSSASGSSTWMSTWLPRMCTQDRMRCAIGASSSPMAEHSAGTSRSAWSVALLPAKTRAMCSRRAPASLVPALQSRTSFSASSRRCFRLRCTSVQVFVFGGPVSGAPTSSQMCGAASGSVAISTSGSKAA
mmetsp:Transcript_16393/g.41659  ORF Transcript_16393/g.41659 Transcript_16393/m.41659 type:complete len:302 (+) Transcript_16393:1020-1925(+)